MACRGDRLAVCLPGGSRCRDRSVRQTWGISLDRGEAVSDLAELEAQRLEVSYCLDCRGRDHREGVLLSVEVLEGDSVEGHGLRLVSWLSGSDQATPGPPTFPSLRAGGVSVQQPAARWMVRQGLALEVQVTFRSFLRGEGLAVKWAMRSDTLEQGDEGLLSGSSSNGCVLSGCHPLGNGGAGPPVALEKLHRGQCPLGQAPLCVELHWVGSVEVMGL